MQLEPGPSGKYLVDVDGQVVAEKTFHGFPTEEEVVAAVAKALGR